MNHVCITYHMKNKKERVETCITLPMCKDIAEKVLQEGADSDKKVRQILSCLASLQGYKYCGACYAEQDSQWKQIDDECERFESKRKEMGNGR